MLDQQHLLKKAEKIQCLICDIDGVMTDGLLYYNHQGQELKAFHVHDGVGLKLLMYAGIQVAVITGATHAVIEHRMKALGITHYFTQKIDKLSAFFELKARLQLENEAFAYIGDDLPDLPLIQQVGLGVAVANAQSVVKAGAVCETQNSGGRGAVREICDFILQAQGKTELALSRYLAS